MAKIGGKLRAKQLPWVRPEYSGVKNRLYPGCGQIGIIDLFLK